MSEKVKKESRKLGNLATILVSGGGVAGAWYLLEMHVQAKVGEQIGGALCGAHEVIDCASAAQSHFSELFGIPIALLGLGFYIALAMMAIFEPEKTREGDHPFRPAALGSTLFLASFLYSLVLGGISLLLLQALCPFCVMLYLVNLLGIFATSIWAGESPLSILKAQIKAPGGLFSRWSFVATVFFAATLIFGTATIQSATTQRGFSSSQDQRAEVERIEESRYRISDAPAKGPENADVHIVEFSNFSCPHCARLASVLHQIEEEYQGQVRVEFRHFPAQGNEGSLRAAFAAECADQQGRFWAMHDQLFVHSPDFERETLLTIAEEIDLEEGAFLSCLDDQATRARIEVDRHDGRSLGVQGTPTFLINGFLVAGAIPLENMRALVEEELSLQE